MLKRSLPLLTALLLVVAALGLTACGSSGGDAVEEPAATESEAPQLETSPEPTTEVTELGIEDLVEGEGAEAKTGDTVTVHYTGYFDDGTKFESSKDSGQPFQFTIGEGKVISGWDEGIPGMKEGGTRKLTIPPDMAYGESGSGPIPPNAVLVFEVDLVSID